ncbi:hypothetical protein BGZ83_000119 [Gryganskiella cystojenkinii]|nr:hypothetical protein BGZ83_000119 [Gryganskiella cystojenkinii]
MVDPRAEEDDQHYQSFRDQGGDLIRLPVTPNPVTNEKYVIWTDLQDCFPNVHRVQHGSIFVPMLRDKDLYRVKPHGVKHYPGVVLDVIYKEDALKRTTTQSTLDDENETITTTTTTTVTTVTTRKIRALVNESGSRAALSHQLDGPTPLVESSHNVPPQSTDNKGIDPPADPATAPQLERFQPNGHSAFMTSPPQQVVSSSASSSSSVLSTSEDMPSVVTGADIDVTGEEDEKGLAEEQVQADLHNGEGEHVDEHTNKEDQIEIDRPSKGQEPGQEIVRQAKVVEQSKVKEQANEEHAQKITAGMNPPYSGMTPDERSMMMLLNELHLSKVTQADQILSPRPPTPVTVEEEAARKAELNRKAYKVLEAAFDELERHDSIQTLDPEEKRRQAAIIQSWREELAVASAAAEKKRAEDLLALSQQPRLELEPAPEPEPYGKNDDEILLEIIGNRVRDVLDRRYRWAESLMPKFFIPILWTDNDTKTGGAQAEEKEDGEEDDEDLRDATRHLMIQFCCDCGEIPGDHDPNRTWSPHWKTHNKVHLARAQNRWAIIDTYGEYMMGLLEMFRYGAYLGPNRRISAPPKSHFLARLDRSIRYLRRNGIKTSRDILEATRGLPREERIAVTPRIKTLESNEDFSRFLRLTGIRRPLQDWIMFMTRDRDARWVCDDHFHALSPNAWFPESVAFSNHKDSESSGFSLSMGCYHAMIKTAERAREFYRWLPELGVCVVVFHLDWELTPEDHAELTTAISSCKAVAIKVEIPMADRYDSPICGFERGANTDFGQILVAGLQNRNIEVFEFRSLNAKFSPKLEDELKLPNQCDSMSSTASFQRDVRSGRISLRAKVTGIDMAAQYLRQTVRGLHHFAKLHLEVYSVWDYVNIEFAPLEDVLMARGQVEDTEYQTDGKVEAFFAKRGFVDRIQYASQVYGDNMFLNSLMLTEISISFTLAQDRERVRKMIKENRHLSKLKLENPAIDDPSQIYESFKALLTNHPTMTNLEIRQRHKGGAGKPSEFRWQHFQDPKKMEIWITTYAEDKIGSMLQKYTTSITTLFIHGITEANANILEKSFRPKKGPFKWRKVWIHDLHLMETPVLDLLQKVIQRTPDLDVVRIVGDIRIGASIQIPYVQLTVGLQNRLTALSLWGEGVHKFMSLFASHLVSVDLPALTDLSLSEDEEVEADPIFSNGFMMNFLLKKLPMAATPVLEQGRPILDKHGWMLFDEDKSDDRLATEEKGQDGSDEAQEANSFNSDDYTVHEANGAVIKLTKKPRGKPLPRPTRYQYQEKGVHPLKSLHLKELWIRDDEWNVLLQLIDWSALEDLHICQRNPMGPLVMKSLLRYIEQGPKIQSFVMESSSSSEGEGEENTSTSNAIHYCMNELLNRFESSEAEIQIRRLQQHLSQMYDQSKLELERMQEQLNELPPEQLVGLQDVQVALQQQREAQFKELQRMETVLKEMRSLQSEETKIKENARGIRQEHNQQETSDIQEQGDDNDVVLDTKGVRCNYAEDPNKRRTSPLVMIQRYFPSDRY